MTNGFVASFTGSYDPRVKGLARLVTVTVQGDVVRIHITGENPVSNNLGFVTLDDAVYTREQWETIFKDMIPTAPDFTVVKGELF